MTFDPQNPQSTDILADSQADLLTNYGQQDTVFGVDHVAFSADENRGKHNKTTLHFQSDLPIPMPADSEITQYPFQTTTARINGNVIYGLTDQICNHIPFAIVYVELQAANAVNDIGNSVNFNLGASSHTGNTVSLVFNVAAQNADYMVFVTPGGKVAAYANIGTIRIENQTVNGFDIRGMNFTTNTEFYVFVYES